MCVYSTQQDEDCVCGMEHEMRYEDEDELLTDEDDGNWEYVPYIKDIETTNTF